MTPNRAVPPRPVAILSALSMVSVFFAAATVSSPLLAQDSGTDANNVDPRAVFAQRASLSAPGADAGDLVRLPLETAVLSECRADLSDLRIFSGDRQLPYVLRRSTQARRILREPAVVRAAGRETVAASTAENNAATQVENYLLDAPSAWTASGDWTLRIAVDTSRTSFARDVELGWTNGTDFETQLRTTIFRLRSGAELDDVRLPPRTGNRLGIRLVGQDTAAGLDPLEPRFIFQRSEMTEEDPRKLDIELGLERHSTDAIEFSVETRLAPGFLVERLRFESATRNLRRRVAVTEIAPDGSEQLIGQAWIQRTTGVAGSMTVELVSSGRPISPTDGVRRLRIAINGGDSPPLDELRIFAQVTQPELVFEWPAAQDVELLFGGGRAKPPRFDLQHAADRRRFVRVPSDVTWSLLTDTEISLATRGRIETNPSFDDQPLLAFLQRPGRAVALTAFRWTAMLDLTDEPTGLYRIPLSPVTLSRVEDDFADLRFLTIEDGLSPADADQQAKAAQWPFLVAPTDEWSLDLIVGPVQETRDRASHTEIVLPETIGPVSADGALEPQRLELTFGQPFFDRNLTLYAVSGNDTVELIERRVTTGGARDAFFSRRITSQASFDISSWSQMGALTGFLVEIEDGDDAPAEILSARLSGPGRQALLVATPGTVKVVFGATGSETLEPPTYELQRARDLVQSLRGREVALGQATPNTEAGRPGFLDQLTKGWQSSLLWIAIVLAILALGWITLRSVRA